MNYQTLLIDVKDKVAIININRPDKLNALNAQTITDIENAFEKLRDNDSVFVVVITGSGEKAFVAGADIAELNKLDVLSAKEFSERGNPIFKKIENFPHNVWFTYGIW